MDNKFFEIDAQLRHSPMFENEPNPTRKVKVECPYCTFYTFLILEDYKMFRFECDDCHMRFLFSTKKDVSFKIEYLKTKMDVINTTNHYDVQNSDWIDIVDDQLHNKELMESVEFRPLELYPEDRMGF